MTHHEQPQAVQVLIVNPSAFELVQAYSNQEFGRPVGELNFEEASRLVGSIMVTATQHGSGTLSQEGRVIIDSAADGPEAFAAFGRQSAREIASRIDDERELVINVVRNKTLWDAILRRKPKTEETFRFRNEPPQYA
jgi:hypothetical protein